jgi:hypothetical protein
MRAAWVVFITGCGFHSPAGATDATSADLDAASSNSVQCPMSYNAPIPGPSRYRLIYDGHRAWEHSDACNMDMPGATHLVVIETPKELDDVKRFVANPGIGITKGGVFLGGVQLKTATSPDEGWLGFDGAPLFNGWGSSEPNDSGDGNEGNHQEQFVEMAQSTLFFIDVAGTDMFGALCECDGKPVAQNAADAIAANRPPS